MTTPASRPGFGPVRALLFAVAAFFAVTFANPGTVAAQAAAGAVAGDLNNSTFAALLFWAFALATVAGSIFVITRRNLVSATMGMVGTFLAVAVLYAMLYAHFMAVIQVLVYAGAIMVLFVFVVMILNKEEDEPWALTGLPGKGLAGVALVYLMFRMGQVLWGVKDYAAANLADVTVGAGHAWGSTRALGHTLFRDYLFPFEAVSLVLLVAVVGAIAIAREPEKTSEPAPSLGADS